MAEGDKTTASPPPRGANGGSATDAEIARFYGLLERLPGPIAQLAYSAQATKDNLLWFHVVDLTARYYFFLSLALAVDWLRGNAQDAAAVHVQDALASVEKAFGLCSNKAASLTPGAGIRVGKGLAVALSDAVAGQARAWHGDMARMLARVDPDEATLQVFHEERDAIAHAANASIQSNGAYAQNARQGLMALIGQAVFEQVVLQVATNGDQYVRCKGPVHAWPPVGSGALGTSFEFRETPGSPPQTVMLEPFIAFREEEGRQRLLLLNTYQLKDCGAQYCVIVSPASRSGQLEATGQGFEYVRPAPEIPWLWGVRIERELEALSWSRGQPRRIGLRIHNEGSEPICIESFEEHLPPGVVSEGRTAVPFEPCTVESKSTHVVYYAAEATERFAGRVFPPVKVRVRRGTSEAILAVGGRRTLACRQHTPPHVRGVIAVDRWDGLAWKSVQSGELCRLGEVLRAALTLTNTGSDTGALCLVLETSTSTWIDPAATDVEPASLAAASSTESPSTRPGRLEVQGKFPGSASVTWQVELHLVEAGSMIIALALEQSTSAVGKRNRPTWSLPGPVRIEVEPVGPGDAASPPVRVDINGPVRPIRTGAGAVQVPFCIQSLDPTPLLSPAVEVVHSATAEVLFRAPLDHRLLPAQLCNEAIELPATGGRLLSCRLDFVARRSTGEVVRLQNVLGFASEERLWRPPSGLSGTFAAPSLVEQAKASIASLRERCPLFLVGPHGSGKEHLLRHLAGQEGEGRIAVELPVMPIATDSILLQAQELIVTLCRRVNPAEPKTAATSLGLQSPAADRMALLIDDLASYNREIDHGKPELLASDLVLFLSKWYASRSGAPLVSTALSTFPGRSWLVVPVQDACSLGEPFGKLLLDVQDKLIGRSVGVRFALMDSQVPGWAERIPMRLDLGGWTDERARALVDACFLYPRLDETVVEALTAQAAGSPLALVRGIEVLIENASTALKVHGDVAAFAPGESLDSEPIGLAARLETDFTRWLESRSDGADPLYVRRIAGAMNLSQGTMTPETALRMCSEIVREYSVPDDVVRGRLVALADAGWIRSEGSPVAAFGPCLAPARRNAVIAALPRDEAQRQKDRLLEWAVKNDDPRAPSYVEGASADARRAHASTLLRRAQKSLQAGQWCDALDGLVVIERCVDVLEPEDQVRFWHARTKAAWKIGDHDGVLRHAARLAEICDETLRLTALTRQERNGVAEIRAIAGSLQAAPVFDPVDGHPRVPAERRRKHPRIRGPGHSAGAEWAHAVLRPLLIDGSWWRKLLPGRTARLLRGFDAHALALRQRFFNPTRGDEGRQAFLALLDAIEKRFLALEPSTRIEYLRVLLAIALDKRTAGIIRNAGPPVEAGQTDSTPKSRRLGTILEPEQLLRRISDEFGPEPTWIAEQRFVALQTKLERSALADDESLRAVEECLPLLHAAGAHEHEAEACVTLADLLLKNLRPREAKDESTRKRAYDVRIGAAKLFEELGQPRRAAWETFEAAHAWVYGPGGLDASSAGAIRWYLDGTQAYFAPVAELETHGRRLYSDLASRLEKGGLEGARRQEAEGLLCVLAELAGDHARARQHATPDAALRHPFIGCQIARRIAEEALVGGGQEELRPASDRLSECLKVLDDIEIRSTQGWLAVDADTKNALGRERLAIQWLLCETCRRSGRHDQALESIGKLVGVARNWLPGTGVDRTTSAKPWKLAIPGARDAVDALTALIELAVAVWRDALPEVRDRNEAFVAEVLGGAFPPDALARWWERFVASLPPIERGLEAADFAVVEAEVGLALGRPARAEVLAPLVSLAQEDHADPISLGWQTAILCRGLSYCARARLGTDAIRPAVLSLLRRDETARMAIEGLARAIRAAMRGMPADDVRSAFVHSALELLDEAKPVWVATEIVDTLVGAAMHLGGNDHRALLWVGRGLDNAVAAENAEELSVVLNLLATLHANLRSRRGPGQPPRQEAQIEAAEIVEMGSQPGPDRSPPEDDGIQIAVQKATVHGAKAVETCLHRASWIAAHTVHDVLFQATTKLLGSDHLDLAVMGAIHIIGRTTSDADIWSDAFRIALRRVRDNDGLVRPPGLAWVLPEPDKARLACVFDLFALRERDRDGPLRASAEDMAGISNRSIDLLAGLADLKLLGALLPRQSTERTSVERLKDHLEAVAVDWHARASAALLVKFERGGDDRGTSVLALRQLCATSGLRNAESHSFEQLIVWLRVVAVGRAAARARVSDHRADAMWMELHSACRRFLDDLVRQFRDIDTRTLLLETRARLQGSSERVFTEVAGIDFSPLLDAWAIVMA